MQDIFDFDGSDIEETPDYSDDEEAVKAPVLDQNLDSSQIIDVDQDLLNLEKDCIENTGEMQWVNNSNSSSPDLFKGESLGDSSIEEFQPPQQFEAWEERKEEPKQQLKRKTKEDFDHAPVLLFDCLYCVSSERTVCKGVLQRSITDKYYQSHIQASNNDTIYVSLPGIGTDLKVTDPQVEEYFDLGDQDDSTKEEDQFHKASLVLKSLEMDAPLRKTILKAKLALVQSEKDETKLIAQQLVSNLPRPAILYDHPIYKVGYAFNKIRTQILGLPGHLTYQNQAPTKSHEVADMIQDIESDTDSNTFIQGEGISINRWAMTRRQRIQRRLSFDSVTHDIYKPQFSSDNSSDKSRRSASSVSFNLNSEESEERKARIDRDGFVSPITINEESPIQMHSPPCSSNNDDFSRELKPDQKDNFDLDDSPIHQKQDIEAFADSSTSSICHVNSPNFDTMLDKVPKDQAFTKVLSSDLDSSGEVELNLLRPLSKQEDSSRSGSSSKSIAEEHKNQHEINNISQNPRAQPGSSFFQQVYENRHYVSKSMNKSAANAILSSDQKQYSLFTGQKHDLKSMSNDSPNIMIEDQEPTAGNNVRRTPLPFSKHHAMQHQTEMTANNSKIMLVSSVIDQSGHSLAQMLLSGDEPCSPVEDKEESMDDMQPLLTVEYFGTKTVNSFLNGTAEDQVMYAQHNATYNGDLPIQTNQLNSAILNNSVPQLSIAQSTSLLKKRVASRDGEYKFRKQALQKSMEESAGNIISTTPRASTSGGIQKNSRYSFQPQIKSNKNNSRPGTGKPKKITTSRTMANTVTVSGKTSSMEANTNNLSKYTVGQQQQRLRRQTAAHLKSQNNDMQVIPESKIGQQKRQITFNKASAGRHGLLVSESGLVFVPDKESKKSHSNQLPYENMTQRQSNTQLGSSVHLTRRRNEMEKQRRDYLKTVSSTVVCPSGIVGPVSTKNKGVKQQQRYLVSKEQRRMTEGGLGGATARDNTEQIEDNLPGGLCSSVEIVQDEQGNLFHLSNNAIGSPTNNSVVLGYDALRNSQMVKRKSQHVKKTPGSRLTSLGGSQNNNTSGFGIPPKTPRQKPIASTTFNSKSTGIKPSTKYRRIVEAQSYTADPTNLSAITSKRMQLKSKDSSSKKISGSQTVQKGQRNIITTQQHSSFIHSGGELAGRFASSNEWGASSPQKGRHLVNPSPTHLTKTKFQQLQKSTSPLMLGQQDVRVKTSVNTSSHSMGNSGPTGFSFSNNISSLKQRGVVRKGIVGKNGSLPNFMPPEESRAGGILIASDEDDLADLYLLDQVVGSKTHPLNTEPSVDMCAHTRNFTRTNAVQSNIQSTTMLHQGLNEIQPNTQPRLRRNTDVGNSVEEVSKSHFIIGGNIKTLSRTEQRDEANLVAMKHQVNRLADKVLKLQSQQITTPEQQPVMFIQSGHHKLQEPGHGMIKARNQNMLIQQSFDQRSSSNKRRFTADTANNSTRKLQQAYGSTAQKQKVMQLRPSNTSAVSLEYTTAVAQGTHSTNILNKSTLDRVKDEGQSTERQHTTLIIQKQTGNKVIVAPKSHSAYSTKKPVIKSQYDVAGLMRRESPGVLLSHRAQMPVSTPKNRMQEQKNDFFQEVLASSSPTEDTRAVQGKKRIRQITTQSDRRRSFKAPNSAVSTPQNFQLIQNTNKGMLSSAVILQTPSQKLHDKKDEFKPKSIRRSAVIIGSTKSKINLNL